MAEAKDGSDASDRVAYCGMSTRRPLVNYEDETAPIDCPYGTVRRVVTAGEGGIANVHVVRVTRGGLHLHRGYDEVYYLLAGQGHIELDGQRHALRPGAVVVIPSGVPHSLESIDDSPLEFVIFGTPPLSISDPLAAPTRPESV